MEKRAHMETVLQDARDQVMTKYANAEVNQALAEVIKEDVQEQMRQAFPGDVLPGIIVKIAGRERVNIHVKW